MRLMRTYPMRMRVTRTRLMRMRPTLIGNPIFVSGLTDSDAFIFKDAIFKLRFRLHFLYLPFD